MPGPDNVPTMWKTYSRDGGRSWTSPEQMTLPTGLQTTGSALMVPGSGPLRGRPILTTWSQRVEEGLVRGTRTHVSVADDARGAAWGPLVAVEMQNGSTLTGGPVTQLDDVTFLQSGYVYAPGDLTEARCVELTWEGGELSVGPVTVLARPTDGSWFSEPNTLLLPDGRILALLRNDNSRGQAMIWQCHSSDRGATWSAARPAFAGSGAPRMLLTSRGDIVVVYRNMRGPSTAEANHGQRGDMDAVYRVSRDMGASWGDQRPLGVHSPFEMSYAVPLEVEAGSVTVVHGSESDPHHSVVLATRDVAI